MDATIPSTSTLSPVMNTALPPVSVGSDDGWGDVDPALLDAILTECFGPTPKEDETGAASTAGVSSAPAEASSTSAAPCSSAPSVAADEKRLAAAFETTFEHIVAPFLVASSSGESQADHIASLHDGLTDCNTRLLQMEGALQEFHSRILDVCTEIEVIRTEALGTRAARDGKRSLQKHITALLDLVVIPPDVVHLVLMTPEYHAKGGLGGGGIPQGFLASLGVGGGPHEELSQQFLLAIRRLHMIIRKRIANQEIVLRRPTGNSRAVPPSNSDGALGEYRQQQALILNLFKCQAFREMVATTEDLLIFVCMRIRAFLEPKVSALENPRTNSVAMQEHVLRGHRQLIRFMQDAAAYLKLTLALRPTPFTSPGAMGQGGGTQGLGTAQDASLLMVQHKPFIPFRVVKALYDDLKVQYLTVLSRVYTARMGRYLTALTETEVGYQTGESAATPIAQSVASSVVGGLTSLFWGSSSPPPAPASGVAASMQGGPSASDHAAAYRAITRPHLIGDRCAVGPFTNQNGGSASAAAASFAANAMSGRNTEIGEDLTSYSLGLRGNMFRGDDASAAGPARGGGEASPSPSPMGYGAGGGSSGNLASNTNSFASTGVAACIAGGGSGSTLVNNRVDPHEGDAGVFRVPTIPHIAKMRRQYHTYEETYRSLHHIISDTVTHEYLFLLDFFGADSWQMCADIFRKTLQNVIDHVSDRVLMNTPRADLLQQHGGGGAASVAASLNTAFSPFISGNRDLGGLLILFRMTLIYRTQMLQVRQLQILEPFYHSLLALLWPAVHAALEEHNRSLRACASIASDRIAALSTTKGGGGGMVSTGSVFMPPPPELGAVATVHPIALRYAELSYMVMQLVDFSFIPHYKHLRRAETLGRMRMGGRGVGPNASPPTAAGSLSGSPVAAYSAEDDDEDDAELASWLTALRSNLGIMRIEVCRILALHCKVYADACNAMQRRKLADEHAPSAGAAGRTQSLFKVVPPTTADERVWMAACAPMVSSLYHVVRLWEERLLLSTDRQRYGVLATYSGPPVPPSAVSVPPPYDLRTGLATGLRREWERSQHTTGTDANTSLAVSPTDNQGSFPAVASSPSVAMSPADSQMAFHLLSSPDYIEMKAAFVRHMRRMARVVVCLGCPSMSHLALVTTSFDDEALADDLLLLAIEFDEDDVAAISHFEDCGDGSRLGDGLQQRDGSVSAQLRYGSVSVDREGGEGDDDGAHLGSRGGSTTRRSDTPMHIRIERLIRYCTVILTRCTHFATTWCNDVKAVRRVVCEYIIQPDLQRAVLVEAFQLLSNGNAQLHRQLTSAVEITGLLHARRERMGDAFEYPLGGCGASANALPMPPVVTSIKGLVVPNQQLIEYLKSFVNMGGATMQHDAHPDL